jgi:hypothetical protein
MLFDINRGSQSVRGSEDENESKERHDHDENSVE